jgi:hypothetical protein
MVQLYDLCTPVIYISITTPKESKVFLSIKFLFLDPIYFRKPQEKLLNDHAYAKTASKNSNRKCMEEWQKINNMLTC